MKVINKLITVLTFALIIATAGTAANITVQTSATVENGIALPILMYHHILKENGRQNAYTITPDEFRTDLRYLKREGYTPIVVQDLLDYSKNKKPLPEKPIMITFDDGYESFHEYAFPILKETGFKAVFAIIGKYVDLYSEADDHHISYSHCTWSELAELQESGIVEIQNHSYDLHSNNKGRKGSKRKPGEDPIAYSNMLTTDLSKVQSLCTEKLDWTPTCYVYPFGHICNDSFPIIKNMGFSAAFTCEEKVNYITGDPKQLFNLKRFNRPHGKSAQEILDAAFS